MNGRQMVACGVLVAACASPPPRDAGGPAKPLSGPPQLNLYRSLDDGGRQPWADPERVPLEDLPGDGGWQGRVTLTARNVAQTGLIMTVSVLDPGTLAPFSLPVQPTVSWVLQDGVCVASDVAFVVPGPSHATLTGAWVQAQVEDGDGRQAQARARVAWDGWDGGPAPDASAGMADAAPP